MKGWIKIHRKFLKWEWYGDLPCMVLALHYLLSANFEDKKWRNQLIRRGQLVTSLNHLSLETGLSVQQIRTTHKKLSDCGFCHIQTTHKYTLVTICKYDYYQGSDAAASHASSTQTARDPQARSQQRKKKKEKESFINLLETNSLNISFLDFWELYDKKIDARTCESGWNSLTDEERSLAMQYIPLYKEAQPDKRYRKNPETFLKQKAWNDELISWQVPSGESSPACGARESPDFNRIRSDEEYTCELHF